MKPVSDWDASGAKPSGFVVAERFHRRDAEGVCSWLAFAPDSRTGQWRP